MAQNAEELKNANLAVQQLFFCLRRLLPLVDLFALPVLETGPPSLVVIRTTNFCTTIVAFGGETTAVELDSCNP